MNEFMIDLYTLISPFSICHKVYDKCECQNRNTYTIRIAINIVALKSSKRKMTTIYSLLIQRYSQINRLVFCNCRVADWLTGYDARISIPCDMKLQHT